MIIQEKTLKTGVFIDGSNLLWAIKMKKEKTGSKINFPICFIKLKQYLERRYSPLFCNYYACEDYRATKEPYISKAEKQKKFHRFLEGQGYKVVRKELKHLRDDTTKCDTDVEITMDIHKHIKEIDKIVLFSGDSDFFTAVKYFQSIGKHIIIFAFKNSLSWELKDFSIKNPRCDYKLLDELKNDLERTNFISLIKN